MKNKKLIAFLLFVASIFLSSAFFIFKDFFRHSQSLGLVGLFLINFASNATLFLPTPAFISVFAAGNLYPPILVALVSSFGAATGDAIGFMLGVSGRHLALTKLLRHKWFVFLEKIFKKHANWLLFLFAIVPNPLFDAVGLIAGIFNYSPLKFFLIIFIGRLIRFFIFATVGASL